MAVNLRYDVLRTTEAFHSCRDADDQAVVDHLMSQGHGSLRAEILLVFVPLGLARAVIARLNAKPSIKLPAIALVLDSEGNHLRVPLSAVPEFVTACVIGEETFTTGVVAREHFSASCRGSVEFILVNKMLDQGVEIGGSEMSPSILMRLSRAPGFQEWYQQIVNGRRGDNLRIRITSLISRLGFKFKRR